MNTTHAFNRWRHVSAFMAARVGAILLLGGHAVYARNTHDRIAAGSPPDIFFLQAPNNLLNTTSPDWDLRSFEWDDSVGATSYDVYARQLSGTFQKLTSTSSTQWTPAPTNFWSFPDGNYEWYVTAHNSNGVRYANDTNQIPATSTNVWSFSVTWPAVSVGLQSPHDAANAASTQRVFFSWNASDQLESELLLDPGITTPSSVVARTSHDVTTIDDLPPGTWSWHVAAHNPSQSATSTIRRFTVGLSNAPPSSLEIRTPTVIPENIPNQAPTGIWLRTTDSDYGETFAYSFVLGPGDSGNDLFVITNNIFIRTSSDLDYETDSNYTVRIQSEDLGGNSIATNFMISVGDVAESTHPILSFSLSPSNQLTFGWLSETQNAFLLQYSETLHTNDWHAAGSRVFPPENTLEEHGHALPTSSDARYYRLEKSVLD
jgi:hypothetical protein